MFKFAKSVTLSALIAVGALAAISAPAQAQSAGANLQLASGGGVTLSFRFGDREPRFRDYRGGYRNHGRNYRDHRRASCSPRQAASKAARMGLRNVRVIGQNRRVIQVVGHSWRAGRMAIVFGKAPHCPVLS